MNIQTVKTTAMLSKELKIRKTEWYLDRKEEESLTTGK